jgi:hypothetical protein
MLPDSEPTVILSTGPAEFIVSIVTAIADSKIADTQLLEVLSARIVKVNAANSAVGDALRDIERLAAERAAEDEIV